ncbi:hypothetical protein BDV93DRAFT_514882 [Ceratobasidium sp. AG-I]|nr:hypothetical protein BDV93DRAFT_514882 [Ceratobasidium sp. AG-I]
MTYAQTIALAPRGQGRSERPVSGVVCGLAIKFGGKDGWKGKAGSRLRVLDMVNKVDEMIRERKYWSALRTLEEIRSLSFSSLPQTAFLGHIFASLPSLRAEVKESVTSEHKSWLFSIIRREKESSVCISWVGCAVELVTNEKVEYDVLNNDPLDTRPPNLLTALLIGQSMTGPIDQTNRPPQRPTIKDYAHQFDQFVEGVSQPPRNIDQILEKSLGGLLIKCVADVLTTRLGTATSLGQVSQMLVNAEYLRDGCAEVDRYLTNLRQHIAFNLVSKAGGD